MPKYPHQPLRPLRGRVRHFLANPALRDALEYVIQGIAGLYYVGIVLFLFNAFASGGPSQISQSYIIQLIQVYPIPFSVFTLLAIWGTVFNVRAVLQRLNVRRHSRQRKMYLDALQAAHRFVPVVLDREIVADFPQDVVQPLEYQYDPARPEDDVAASQKTQRGTVVQVTDVLDLFGKSGSATRKLVILGTPGSGKTTFLERSLVVNAHGARQFRNGLPVYIRLPQFAKLLADNEQTAVARYLEQNEEAVKRLSGFAEDLQQEIERDHSRILLFLDGVDEVYQGYRLMVREWIAARSVDEGEGAIIIGTRFDDYSRADFGDFAEWVPLVMETKIQHDFASNLLKALFDQLSEEQHRHIQPPATEAFFQIFAGHSFEALWRGNPLLLTLAAYIFVQHDRRTTAFALPPSRVELYEESIKQLLRRIVVDIQTKHPSEVMEGIRSKVRRALAEVALRILLATTMTAQKFTKEDLEDPIHQLCHDLNMQENEGEIVRWVVESGTLQVLGQGHYAFRHHTFQEYLAALALAKRLINGDVCPREETWQVLREKQGDQAWFNTLRLLAGVLMAESSAISPQGRQDARQWLRALVAEIALDGSLPRDDMLALAVASVTEIPDLAVLGDAVDMHALMAAWVAAMMRNAQRGQAETLERLQSLAVDVANLPPAFADLARALLTQSLSNHSDPVQQMAAARAMGGMRDARLIAPLECVLRDVHEPAAVRQMVAQALAQFDQAGRAVLEAALASHQPVELRRTVAGALSGMGASGVPLMTKAASDVDDEVARLGVLAMGTLGVSVPFAELDRAFASPRPAVRAAAIIALVQAAPQNVEQVLGHPGDDASMIAALRTLSGPQQSETAFVALTALSRKGQRARAQIIASALTQAVNTSVDWRLWAVRARLEDAMTGVLDCLDGMRACGAPNDDIAATWRNLVPARLQELGFEGQWFHGTAVIVPPDVEVPSGPFTMGSDKRRDRHAQSDEPQSTLFLGAFRIGAYPVTVAEYACMVHASKSGMPQKSGDVDWAKQQQHPDHPVVNVTWADATSYARWLSAMTGEAWRLPTEAEWEKAARGTDGRIYPWGDAWDKARANTIEGGPQTTTPVGQYSGLGSWDPKGDASPYGCHDMAGNVWEWTSSIYGEPYDSDKSENDSDRKSDRAVRGGSWNFALQNARAALNDKFGGNLWDSDGGFRLARGRVRWLRNIRPVN